MVNNRVTEKISTERYPLPSGIRAHNFQTHELVQQLLCPILTHFYSTNLELRPNWIYRINKILCFVLDGFDRVSHHGLNGAAR